MNALVATCIVIALEQIGKGQVIHLLYFNAPAWKVRRGI